MSRHTDRIKPNQKADRARELYNQVRSDNPGLKSKGLHYGELIGSGSILKTDLDAIVW